MAVSCWCQMKKPDWLFCLGYRKTLAIYHVKCHVSFYFLTVTLSRESPVTRTTSISCSKRVIYHGKSVPCNRTLYRPFPHYAPVNKHKEMRTRLGWTVSYKSLYFVHPSLELVPLFTGMRERSITFP